MPGAPAHRQVGAREGVSLATFTTLGLGGPARRFTEVTSSGDLLAAVRAADEGGEPLLILGGGSNLVVADEGFPGTVVRVGTRGITVSDRYPGRGDDVSVGRGSVEVTVAAGEDWDGVVAWSVSEGLAGLECLSGIPGLAGATPIQNVGAYGQEVADTVTAVRAYDRVRRAVTGLSRERCRFGYRDSVFKTRAGGRGGSSGLAPGDATGRFVVLDVTFRLIRSDRSLPLRYPDLAAALGEAGGASAPLADVREAVLGLRRAKGMVLEPADPDTRSAGSFFTNPVLGHQQFATLEQRVAATLGDIRVPRYPAEGGVKVPAAWLIERAGFRKGYPGPGAAARISSKHTLALVNAGGASTAGLLSLAREISDGVRATFGVELAREPAVVGAGI